MPKYDRPNKKLGSQREARHTTARGAHVTSIGKLLTITPILRQRAALAVEKQELGRWLRAQLDNELAFHTVAAEMKAGTLIVTADSAAWSARLRYALAGLKEEVKRRWPEVQAAVVRVRPRRS